MLTIVSHQGEPFSEADIESICSVGDGNKKGDENKTGFKGIGFKSVFSHSNYVVINSGDYCFRFDKNTWIDYWSNDWGDKAIWKAERVKKGKEESNKMPWQIIPKWTELDQTFSYIKSYNVSTIIHCEDTSKLEKELFDLFSSTQILLFLRSKQIKITISGNQMLTIEKTIENGTLKLKQDGITLTEWLLKTFELDIDSPTRDLVKNDIRIPKKLRHSIKTEISFAVQLENQIIKPAKKDNRLIFTYLPTSVNYNFPFLVNASFLTDAGRQHLHEDIQWNIWLFKQIPILLFKWLSELALTGHNKEIMKLIPQKFIHNSDIMNSFDEGFDLAIQQTAFIPNQKGKLLKASEAILDKTGISEFLDPQILIDFINSKKNTYYTSESLIPSYEPQSTLKRIGVEITEIDLLSEFFESNSFKNKHAIEENFSLIKFLYNGSERYSDNDDKKMWNLSLKNIPFIFDENLELRSPNQIYFPSKNELSEFLEGLDSIHNSTMIEIDSDAHIKNWLELLGVKKPSNISFIEKTIIGNKDYITNENAIAAGRCVFDAYKNGLLKEDHYASLKTVKVITKGGKLISAQDAFLSDTYEPKLKLEAIYHNDFFISDKYFTSGDLISEWKSVFLKLGVKEDISWTREVIEIADLEGRPDLIFFNPFIDDLKTSKYAYTAMYSGNTYYFYPKRFIVEHFSLFIELTSSHEGAKLFWEKAFNKDFSLGINIVPKGVCGFYSDVTRRVQDTDYFKWTINNLDLFPTLNGKIEKASAIFINTPEIKDLVGNYLPVLDFHNVVPENWLEIIPFKKSLDLDDYLFLLAEIWKDVSTDDELRKENKKRVGRIYQILADNYLGYESKLRKWAESNNLMAKDGKSFYSPNELTVVTVDGFMAPNLAFCDEKNEKVVELLKIFGVTVVDKIEAHISNSCIEVQDFKNQLNHILPLIALVAIEKSRSTNDWEIEFYRLENKLKNIRFYKTTEISLSYGNDEDRQERSSWSQGADFYYIGDWYKPRVLDGLVEPLGRFLGIRYAERHLSVLLSDTFEEGILYLKEKFGENTIQLLPTHHLNPKDFTVTAPNAENRPFNKSDEDMGLEGELFVFNELKKVYAQKYQDSICETKSGFKVGSKVEVIWRNKIDRTNSDHDFKIIENGDDIYIDSKATRYDEKAEKAPFYISPNEFQLMETASKYLIARVFKIYSPKPSLKFIKMNVGQLN